MKYGWVWRIPLSNRIGNGYVYSSDYISKEEVETEFREYLGKDAEGIEALHLRWSPGRLENHWKNNCVAIGLSQGFLEPLEALMINIIQNSIEEICIKTNLTLEELIISIKSIPIRVVPYTLEKWGVKENQLAGLASKCFTKGRMDNNIVDLDKKQVINILTEIY